MTCRQQGVAFQFMPHVRCVIEKGQDNDGYVAAAVCSESAPDALDRVQMRSFFLLTAKPTRSRALRTLEFAMLVPARVVFTPVRRARLWALLHGHGVLPVVNAYETIAVVR